MIRSMPTGVFFVIFFSGVIAGCSSVKKEGVDPLDTSRSLIEAGQLEAGLTLFEKSMDEEPHRLDLSNAYRFHASSNKQYERAVSYFKKAIEGKHERVNEMSYNLAFAYIDKIPSVGPMGAGFLSKRAIRQFENVLDREPDDWIATYGIGMNYLHWPDYFKKNDNAMIFLEKSVKLQTREVKPFYILTYIRLGDAYAKNGFIDRAYGVWNEGLHAFPDHPDLVDRVNTHKDNIANAIRLLYNPNNSIGEINTDISVLWGEDIPDSLVPLTKNPLRQAGVGGQLKSSEIQVGEGKIGLFSWFMRNLPFLSDKSRFQSVDMSALGIDEEGKNHHLASIVAHGMIMGFLSQFEEESPAEARKRADNLSAFHRPFFHEGLGMGYAATASLDNMDELKNLIGKLEKIDPNYTRLHLAGAGMWFGLESGNSMKVKKAFAQLGDFGEAYAYEGYGFSQTLFYFKNNPELIEGGAALGQDAAHNFYHGVGRALWILSGEDTQAFYERIQKIPEAYQMDAMSGYGMGVAFTKIENPDFIFSFLNKADSNFKLDRFLTGVSMGLTIRDVGDSAYVKDMIATASVKNRCQIERALALGQSNLESNRHGKGDLHNDWRRRIQAEIVNEGPISVWKVCI